MLVIDTNAQSEGDEVYAWLDSNVGNQQAQPDAIPTPFNPVPFPNLPAPGSLPTIHP